MKRALLSLLGLVLLLGLAIAAGADYLLQVSLRPETEMAAKHDRAWEYLFDEYPYLRPWVDSLQRTRALRDTTLIGPQGNRMHALYAAAAQPTGRTAVIVHGYTDEAVRMLMIGYLYLHDLGCNILLPDLYHHGESEGEAIRMGWLDRWDVIRWMGVANDLFGARSPLGQTRMVVHGISMGAATTMMVAGEPQPDYVRCFVEDCGYTDVRAQFAKELKERYGLPAFPLLDAASLLCRWRYGWSFREASALEQVRHASRPMLFIHGAADTFVPTEMVYPLYEAKPGEKELWVVPGAAHALSYRDNRAAYTACVGAFVDRWLGPRDF